MTSPPQRPHPFARVFGDLAAARFPAIREAIPADADLDTFLMAPAAIELLHDMRPDEGLGEAVDDFVAFVHAAWRHWADGAVTVVCDTEATRALCASGDGVPAGPPPVRARYIQVAPRLVWGQLADGESWEPLDGWFVLPVPAGLRIVACFGLHAERPGLSVVALEGAAPGVVRRADGSASFAPLMPGGDRAGLYAVAAPEELLLLAWRGSTEATEG